MALTEVASSTSSPYNALVYIEAYFPSGAGFSGTGVMVGQNDVLTASHLLYMASQGGAATSVRIIPAYDPSPYALPYGEYTSTSFHYFANYDPDGDGLISAGDGSKNSLGGSELDIGIIDLSTAIGNTTGYMKIDSSYSSGTLNITGYPAAYGHNLMTESGYAAADRTDALINYTGFTLSPGNSGGPVWYMGGDGQAHVVGVVSTAASGAATSGTYNQLMTWINGNDGLITTTTTTPPPTTTTPPPTDTTTPPPTTTTSPPPTTTDLTLNGTSINDNLVGGNGNDTINGLGRNDVLNGMGGNDTLDGGYGYDTAAYNGARNGYWVAHANGALTVTDWSTGTTDKLYGIERLTFTDATVLTHAAPASADFNGDGKADMLLRNLSTGGVEIRYGNGLTAGSGASTSGSAGTDWTIAGTGDFNGDGKGDILWQHDSGATAIWTMNGTQVVNGGMVTQAPANAVVAAVGDFNGDHKSDVLWRANDGTVSLWQMNDHTVTSNSTVAQRGLDWSIAGTGDFNGDGKTDVLWQQDNGTIGMWLMDGKNVTASASISQPSVDWRISGIGDFNGDHKSDILFRHDGGAVSIWNMNGMSISGGWGTVTETPPVNWTLAGIGDFNGDQKSDILWQDNTSGLRVELMNNLTALGTGTVGTLGSDWVVT